MVKLVIISETPLGYEPDIDYSFDIPESGELPSVLNERLCDEIKQGALSKFVEHFSWGRSSAPDRSPREFPSVRFDDNYQAIWVEERHEWIGIFYNQGARSDYEQNMYGGGVYENISAFGPYKLSEEFGKLIADAYKIPQKISPKEVLKMSPSLLEILASKT